MKVVHLETGFHLYGGAQQVVYLLSELQEDPRVYNILVCPPGSGVYSSGAPLADEAYALSMRGEADICFFVRFYNLLQRIRPELVHIHSRRGADIWGGIAAKLSGAAAIVTRRVDNPEHAVAVRWKYRLYDRVVTISQGIREVLLKQGVPASKMVCVPSAVQSSGYEQECHGEWFLQEFGLQANDIPIGLVAQFIERKGHRYLLEALPGILQRFPEVKALFFGRGPLEKSLRQSVAARGLSDRVVFAGFRQDLDKVLPCLRLLVHPATMEGLGVSLLQAAAARVPIVAFASGGIPEVVHHGENGYLVAPKDVAGLAAAINAILEDRKLAAEMGQSGRRLVRERFSIQAMARGNKAIYEEVLASRAE
jgi:glycosyltransferase involved in cell wall biosynthesis